jgi:hypothetical protein
MIDTPSLPEKDQINFFNDILESTFNAEKNSIVKERYIELAGLVIRLVFSGDALMSAFMPALSHLEIPDSNTFLFTFHIWDSDSTNVDPPPPPFKSSCYTDRGDIWGMNSNRIHTAFHWIECSINVMDMHSGTAVYWVKNPKLLPYWCFASPLRTLFHWSMSHYGNQLLHAACVGNNKGGILITGKGGTGKSSTALSCLRHGMYYLADDYLVVSLIPEPRVYSLYSTAKINTDQLSKYKEFNSQIINHNFLYKEKAVIQLWPQYEKYMPKYLPINLFVTPSFSIQSETFLGPISKSSIRNAASFTTLCQLPYKGDKITDFIVQLSNQLPCFNLTLGQNRNLIPKAINDFLSSEIDYDNCLEDNIDRTPRALISVIMPIYNGAEFLREAISNIVSQYPQLEIILIDDGSTDNILEVVKSLCVDVRFFRQENLGPSAARNRGIKEAAGEYIAFLDVDDLWPENNLEFMMNYLMNNSEIDVVHGFGQLMNLNKNLNIYEYVGNPKESFPYYIGAGLYKNEVFEKVGLFDNELWFGEDTDWFNRAIEKNINIKKLDYVSLFVRRHGNNTTSGKSLLELNTLRAFKKKLDRQRAL